MVPVQGEEKCLGLHLDQKLTWQKQTTTAKLRNVLVNGTQVQVNT